MGMMILTDDNYANNDYDNIIVINNNTDDSIGDFNAINEITMRLKIMKYME